MIKWRNSPYELDKWKEGKTGFPIIDAGMRELKSTGYMHNRVRMLTAMFLTRNLMIYWIEGEKYFSQQLVDCDAALNNGNWQWVAGTGVDPLRYGQPRMMNPWVQTKKVDAKCHYIRKWIPELSSVPIKDILSWDSSWKKYPGTYLEPMVNYSETINRFMESFNQHLPQ